MKPFRQTLTYKRKNYSLVMVTSHLVGSRIDTLLRDLYNQCFNANLYFSIISSLLNFTGGEGPSSKGISVTLLDNEEKPIFLASWLWNFETHSLELYNTCKDPHEKTLSAFTILSNIHNLIIPEMIKKYSDGRPVVFRLAVLQKNPFLIAAIHTYSQLGFRVERRPFPVTVSLDNYFTMRIIVTQHEDSKGTRGKFIRKQKTADNLIRVAVLARYSHNDIMNLLEAVIYKYPKIFFNKRNTNSNINNINTSDLRAVWMSLKKHI